MSSFSKYIVLDIDNTLVYSKPKNMLTPFIKGNPRVFYIRPTAAQELYTVNVRKHLAEFLKDAHRRGYKIVVWSAGSESYVKTISSVLFKNISIDYLLTTEHLIKDLKDLKVIEKILPDFNVSNCRLIDDNSDHSKGQEKSFVLIPAFKFPDELPNGAEDDDVLLTILDKVDASYN